MGRPWTNGNGAAGEDVSPVLSLTSSLRTYGTRGTMELAAVVRWTHGRARKGTGAPLLRYPVRQFHCSADSVRMCRYCLCGTSVGQGR